MVTLLTYTLLIFTTAAFAQDLRLVANHSGQAFFDGWVFFAGTDALDIAGQPGNMGNVNWTDQAFAAAQNLTSVNSAGNVILKADDFTSGVGNPTYGRNTLLLYSKEMFNPGSLVIMDAVHLPFGCSVWPAFWTRGQGDKWPVNGEIDILENVNLATHNQYSLHTTAGCTHPPSTAGESSRLVSPDCFVNATGQAHNQGCVLAGSDTSFGKGFADVGGGVFAMMWNDEGIRIWHFERANIPADASTSAPNPRSWPAPAAFWPQSTCDTTKFFGPQTLILNINICGGFAGIPQVFQTTCSGVCTDLVQTPANYRDAYFEIRYLTVFSNATSQTTSSSAPPPPATTITTLTTSTIEPSATVATSNALSHRTLDKLLCVVVSTFASLLFIS